MRFIKIAVVMLGILGVEAAQAAPFDLVGWLNNAKGGEVLQLPPGDYGTVNVPEKSYSKPVRVVATGSTFGRIGIGYVKNLTWSGGTVTGYGREQPGVDIRYSTSITIERMTVTNARVGISMQRSQDVALLYNTLQGLHIDGVNIAESQRVLVQGNVCRNFTPILAVYDGNGKLVRDGDHPDCIQAWSRKTTAPTADITVRSNWINGQMQGVFFGDQIVNGVGDGGFDRIKIVDNRVRVTFPNGVRIENGRASVVIGNKVDTVPGSMLPMRRDQPVAATVVKINGTGTWCGNSASAGAWKPDGVQPCTAEELARK